MLDVGQKVDNITDVSHQMPIKVTPNKDRKVKNTKDEDIWPLTIQEDSQKMSQLEWTLKPSIKAKNQDLLTHFTKLLSLD